MTQTPSRDWQKDMEICRKVNEWYGYPWEAGTEENSGVWRIHEILADEPCQFVAECENEQVTDFIMTAHEALPYWLQEAKERGEREQQLKEAVEEFLPDMMPVTRALMKRKLSTLYPDTPAPTPLKTRHVCFHCDGEKRFMIPNEDQAPTIEPCEICNGEGTLLYDEEQLKQLLPDLAPKEERGNHE